MNRGLVSLSTDDVDVVPVCGRHFKKCYLESLSMKERYEQAVGHLKYLLVDVNDLKSRYISLGFHLDEFNRLRYYSTLGFNDIYDFAEANLGIERSAVSRCIAVFKNFSSPEDKMHIDKKYKDYSYSQLCEMVCMSEKDRKKVKPEMTVKQIRELKKQAKVKASGVVSNDDITGQTSIEHDFPEYMPEDQKELQEPVKMIGFEGIESATGKKVRGCFPEYVDFEKDFAGRYSEYRILDEGTPVDEKEPSEKTQEASPDPIYAQPKLPILKNDAQRREWLENYKAWGLWYYDEHIDVNYYKYDFADGIRLIVSECLGREEYWRSEPFDEHQYYLLHKGLKNEKGKIFDQKFCFRGDVCMTDLLTYLKSIKTGKKSSTK